MSDTTTVQIARWQRDELERIREKYKLASVAAVIGWLIERSKAADGMDDLRHRIEVHEKQIAYLLQQVGGAGEDDQTRE